MTKITYFFTLKKNYLSGVPQVPGINPNPLAKSAGAVEYTDCISAKEYDPLPYNKCPIYDTKKSDEAPVIVGLWEMQSTPSSPLLSGPLWPRVVAPDRVLSMGQIELIYI